MLQNPSINMALYNFLLRVMVLSIRYERTFRGICEIYRQMRLLSLQLVRLYINTSMESFSITVFVFRKYILCARSERDSNVSYCLNVPNTGV